MADSSDNKPNPRQSTQERSWNVPLTALGLSRRVYNALMRSGIRTVEDLVQTPHEQLQRIRNIGPTAQEEIERKLELHQIKRPPPVVFGEEILPDADDKWHKTFRALAFDRAPLSKLQLTEVLEQKLIQAGIHTVGDLAHSTSTQLLALPLVGGTVLTKLRTTLIDYLYTEYGPFVEHSEGEFKITGETSGPFTISQKLTKQLAHILLGSISIEKLQLDPVQADTLQQAGINSIDQLIEQSKHIRLDSAAADALRRYLTVLTTEGPSRLVEDALSVEQLRQIRINEATNVAKWVASLPERERDIIEKRFGLHGPRYKLEEIGQQLGLTRERVRQLVLRTLSKLKENHGEEIRLITGTLLDYIHESGGIVTLDEAAAWLRERQGARNQVEPEGTLRLLIDLLDNIKVLRQRDSKAILHHETPAELITTLQAAMAELLEARMAPTDADTLLNELRDTPTYHSARQTWPDIPENEFDTLARACLRTDEFIEREPGVYGRRRWENRITDDIIVVLREIGEPAHFSIIADAVNQRLPHDRQTKAHNVHALMQRYNNLFVRVGHGIYGLAEWGLKDEDTVIETAARVLRDAGQPLHIETITDEVLKSWQINRSTVYAALSSETYYREGASHADLCLLLGERVFSLAEWEVARATVPNPVLPFCPPILPDPPDFENALFESVMVANEHLASRPKASTFLAKIFAWVGYDSEPGRWLQQGVLNSYYLLGLIPYTYIFGGDDPRLSSTLPDGPINEIREGCLISLTQRLNHMHAFWWLLSHRLPARQKELAAGFVAMRGDTLDDTNARLTMLAGMGCIIRGEDYYFRLTSLGKTIANTLGTQPLTEYIVESPSVKPTGHDLVDFGALE